MTSALKVLLWVKFYQTALHATEKLFIKGRANECASMFIVVFLLEIPTAPPQFCNYHSDQSAVINVKAGQTKKDYDLPEV